MFQDGMTALHKAAGNGYQDKVALLLDRGVDIEAKNHVRYINIPSSTDL